MFDTDLDHIHDRPNSMGIALYYIVLYNGNQENDSDNRYYNYKISRKSFPFECTNMNHRTVLCDHTVKNYIQVLIPPFGTVAFVTIAFDATFSFYAAVYNPAKSLPAAGRPFLFDRIHIPVGRERERERQSIDSIL